MSLTPRWGERDTLKLIELYKKYRFLWDYESNLYKNTGARNKAFEAIVMHLNIPGLSTNDVRSKIKNLRTSYYQEKRKLAIAKANNKVIKPLRWFHAFKGVMDSIYNRKLKMDETCTDESEASDEDKSESVVPTDPNVESDLFLEEVPSHDADTYVVSIKQEFLDEMENLGDKSITLCDYLEPVQSKRARHEASKSVESHKTIEIASVSTREPQRSVREKSCKKVDEFQLFANNIAHQLRKLPLNRALNLQIEVQTLIAKERIDLLKQQCENNEESS